MLWVWLAGSVISLLASWYTVLFTDVFEDEDRDGLIVTVGILSFFSIVAPWLVIGAALCVGIGKGFVAVAGRAIDKADTHRDLKAERARLVQEAKDQAEEWMAAALKQVDRDWIAKQKELANG